MARKKKTEDELPEVQKNITSLEKELQQSMDTVQEKNSEPEKKLTVTKSTKGKKKIIVTDEENKEVISKETNVVKKVFPEVSDSVAETVEEKLAKRKEDKKKKEEQRLEEKKQKAEKNDKLKLPFLINESYKFVRGEITLEEFNNLGEQIDVIAYIPILNKMRIIMQFVYEIQHLDTETHELNVLEIQKKLFFDVILKEYAGIDVSDRNLVNYSSYDLLYPLFYPYIIQFCEADYNLIVKMIDDSLNLYNLQNLVDLLNSADYEKIEEQSKNMRKLINTLNANKGLISDIKDIVTTTGQASNNFNKVITDAVLTEEKIGK